MGAGFKRLIAKNFGSSFLLPVICVLFFIYSFLIFRTDYDGPDAPLYFAYTESIIEDFDLNLADELFFNGSFWYGRPFTISKTGHYTDYHNHGGITLWAPFYLYGKAAAGFAGRADAGRVVRAAMGCGTIVFALVCMFLVWTFARRFFGAFTVFIATVCIYFGTPFFFFVITEPANVQVLAAMFYAVGLFVFSRLWCADTSKAEYLLAGLFLGMSFVVKVDLWFLVFFVSAWAVVLIKNKKTDVFRLAVGALGVCLCLLLKNINDFVKYGELRQGEFSLINPTSFTFFEQLFSSYRGIFYSAPIALIALASVWFLWKNVIDDVAKDEKEKVFSIFCLCLVFAFEMKLLFMGFRYFWGGGTPGARHILSEFPLLVLLLCVVVERVGKKLLPVCGLIVLSVLAVLWNMQMIAQYVEDVDLLFFSNATPLLERLSVFWSIWPSLGQVKDFALKLDFLWPLCMAVVLAVFVIHSINRKKADTDNGFLPALSARKVPAALKAFVLYVFAAYLVATGLNLSFSSGNVERMRRSAYLSNAVVSGAERFEDWENMGCIDELIVYFTVRGKWNRVRKLIQTRRKYLGLAAPTIKVKTRS